MFLLMLLPMETYLPAVAGEPDFVPAVTVARNGDFLYVGFAGALAVISVPFRNVQAVLPVPEPVVRVVGSPLGTEAFWVGPSGTVYHTRFPSRRTRSLDRQPGVRSMAWSATGVVLKGRNGVSVWSFSGIPMANRVPRDAVWAGDTMEIHQGDPRWTWLLPYAGRSPIHAWDPVDNRAWMWTLEEGLISVDLTTGTVDRWTLPVLPGAAPTALIPDQASLWVLMEGRVVRVRADRPTSYPTAYPPSSTTAWGRTRFVDGCRSEDGRWWFVAPRGVVVLDGRRWQPRRQGVPDRIAAVVCTPQGIWVGTTEGIWDLQQAAWRIRDLEVRDLVYLPPSTWVLTPDRVYRQEGDAWTTLKADLLPPGELMRFGRSAGALWVLGRDGALRLTLDRKRWERLPRLDAVVDRDGEIWAAMGREIYRSTPEDLPFLTRESLDPPLDQPILDLAVVARRLWVLTDRGLGVYRLP